MIGTNTHKKKTKRNTTTQPWQTENRDKTATSAVTQKRETRTGAEHTPVLVTELIHRKT